MAELSYDQLIRRISKGERGGNFFLKVEDTFLRDEAIRLLADAHLEGGSSDFDLDQVSGDDADPAALASLLDTPPLLSEYRVVVIRDAQGLTPTARAVVEEAVRATVPGRVLIVAADIPRRSKAKFYDVLGKRCTTVALRTPSASELPGWLVQRARALHSVELDVEAAQLLATGIGSRLGALAQELDKLALYVDSGSGISAADVRASVGALPQIDRWAWIDKVAERRIGEAVAELPALLDSGESAVGLITALGESFLRVGLAQAGEGALIRVLKRDKSYHNLRWKVRVYCRQARAWEADEIGAALEELLRADRLIKSGGLADRAALEEALLRIGSLGEVRSGESGGDTLARSPARG